MADNDRRQDPAPPDPDRWWNRKWDLTKAGFAFAILSILSGMGVGVLYGPEMAAALEGYSKAGMWGGLSFGFFFMGTGVAENISNIIWRVR